MDIGRAGRVRVGVPECHRIVRVCQDCRNRVCLCPFRSLCRCGVHWCRYPNFQRIGPGLTIRATHRLYLNTPTAAGALCGV